jgi:drug/metabolite transporter (DMT)-like permease
LRDLCVRLIPHQVPSNVIAVGTALAATALAGIWCLFSDWVSVQPVQWLLLLAAAVFLSSGYFFLIMATRLADMSVIAPFRYMGLLTAVVGGFLIWGDVPNALACLGMVLLVSAGLLMLYLNIQRTPEL